MYISEEAKKQIIERADLLEVASDFGILKGSGNSRIQECPNCGSKKMTITPDKGLFKCFVCDVGGNTAVSYLMRATGKGYREALQYLADKYGMDLDNATGEPGPAMKPRPRNIPFWKSQLDESGIHMDAIQFMRKMDDRTMEQALRYTPGSVNKFFDILPTGDDMIIHYLDFNWKPITYTTPRGKAKPFFRVRYANPSLQAKDGSRPKYRSPYKGGNHLYIPNYIIKAVQKSQLFETLVICEGEKKADKLCIHDIPAVGIAGIHNLSAGDAMPLQFERIIHECGVKNVLFLLDNDWKDLKMKPGKSVDLRPKTFSRAVIKFRDYFYQYAREGYDLKILFGSHKDGAFKGIDDLLVRGLKGKEDDFKSDLQKAIHDRTGQGEFLELFNVTTLGEYQIRAFWKLHSKEAFFNEHKEDLKKAGEFKFGQILYRVNESGEFELAQKILPHEQYWKKDEWETRSGKTRFKYQFSYQGARVFLKNRGFGKMPLGGEAFRFVQLENRIIHQVSPQEIQDYVTEFTEQIGERHVLEMILSGGFRYFGDKALQAMYHKDPQIMEPLKDAKYMIFKNTAWKITADDIEKVALRDLPGNVWSTDVIDFEPDLIEGGLFQLSSDGGAISLSRSPDYSKSELALFIENTSNFYWRKEYNVMTNKQGQQFVTPKTEAEDYTENELDDQLRNTISKMLATGYVLQDYKDRSNMKAIIAMDGIDGEVGKSNGGTGKSIWGTMFEHLTNIFVIDAKAPKLTEDQFLYDGVDDRTKVITFDDCRVNIDFEFFLSQITRGVTVNGKGQKKFTLNPPPFFIFLTNHAIRGDDNSTLRRQYLISFSDYYNAWRTPKDDFGHLLFYEWDHQQWNLFFNYMASCIQSYLRLGLKKVINDQNLKRRKLKQFIGEDFIEWAELYFHEDSGHINKKLEKSDLYDEFRRDYPGACRYINLRKFKKIIKAYAQYSGLTWNPASDGNDYKSNGREYFTLADDDFDIKIWDDEFMNL